MNLQQLRALFWLRWRVVVNRFNRTGWLSATLIVVLSWLVALLAIGLFAFASFIGWRAFPKSSPETILFAWDVVVVSFLIFWTIGLVADLQRSDILSLSKLLHLPISPAGAFTVNYLSSLFCPSLIVFAPVMVGLSLGLLIGRGSAMLPLAPLVLGLLLLVTALTHQFQGWLASLMANKRRRRTILFLITAVLVLGSQAPNYIFQRNIQSTIDSRSEEMRRMSDELAELQRAVTSQEIDVVEFERRSDLLQSQMVAGRQAALQRELDQLSHIAWLANLALPPGWMPLGAKAAAQGQIGYALLSAFGLTLLGAVSLWQSYRTTVRLYTGHFTTGKKRAAAPRTNIAAVIREPAMDASAPSMSPIGSAPPLGAALTDAALPITALPNAAFTGAAMTDASPTVAASRSVPAVSVRKTLLEHKIPWLPEQAAVVAACTFRSLTRAPEVKMILLTPVLMAAVMGPMMLRSQLSEDGRPLFAFGAMGFILVSLIQLLGNQFGLDRSGFQVFVLSGASRRDILLGKNMAVAPYAIGMGLVATVALQVMKPMRLDLLLAVPFQFVSMYLLFCLLANWMSIIAPIRIPVGTMRGAKPSFISIVLQLLLMFVLFPLTMTPTLLPLGIQLLLEHLGWTARVPVCLLLSAAECTAVVFLYRLLLRGQGLLLQERELEILGIVRSKEE